MSSYIPGLVRVLFQYDIDTEQCENVYSFRFTHTPSEAELNTLAHDFGEAVKNKLKQAYTTHVAFRQVIAKDISSEGRAQGQWIFANNTTGERISSPVANNEAVNVTLRSGFVGKGQHGAKSYSGFGEADIDGNTISTYLMQIFLELAVILLQTWGGGVFIPVIAKPLFNSFVKLGSIALKDAFVDSQKTRLPKHGT